jgi:hypothetical protein
MIAATVGVTQEASSACAAVRRSFSEAACGALLDGVAFGRCSVPLGDGAGGAAALAPSAWRLGVASNGIQPAFRDRTSAQACTCLPVTA